MLCFTFFMGACLLFWYHQVCLAKTSKILRVKEYSFYHDPIFLCTSVCLLVLFLSFLYRLTIIIVFHLCLLSSLC